MLMLLALLVYGSALPIGARAQSMTSGGLPIDGITCDRSEGAVEHIHARLQLFDHGRRVDVPGDIGVMPIAGCLYWLHTHSTDGQIHIESPVMRTFTLGQFFDVWGEDLGRSKAGPLHGKLRFIVNGRAWSSDPRRIPLRDGELIIIRN
jgi:hypothetical protein